MTFPDLFQLRLFESLGRLEAKQTRERQGAQGLQSSNFLLQFVDLQMNKAERAKALAKKMPITYDPLLPSIANLIKMVLFKKT